jgi:mannosyl-oligosaccharide alpha-1,2-mannosidase
MPPGISYIASANYLLRPEALESVFYLYRITGSPYWREKGWNMITSILRHTETEFGHSAIDDVTKTHPKPKDSMESFWLAETLKYAWLLFEEEDRWSLDHWILNTEAHLFRRPDAPRDTR